MGKRSLGFGEQEIEARNKKKYKIQPFSNMGDFKNPKILGIIMRIEN